LEVPSFVSVFAGFILQVGHGRRIKNEERRNMFAVRMQ
jgi:hypothetical protein